MIPLLNDQKVGLMVWSPLSGGLLSGKYKRGGNDEEGRLKDFPYPLLHKERAFDVLDVLSPMAEQKKRSVAQLALAWLVYQPAVTSVIIDATKITQLEDNLKSVAVEFSKDERRQLDEVSRLPPEYPGAVIEALAGDRR